METIERQFSELLRQPNEVIAELDEHDVVLKRRGQKPLRLSQAARDEQRAEALLAMARILRLLVRQAPQSLEPALLEVFPWITFLPPHDRQAFAAELTQVLLASADLQSFTYLMQILREWKATAKIHADPELHARLTCEHEHEDTP